jgi:hypothetical protein
MSNDNDLSKGPFPLFIDGKVGCGLLLNSE